MKRLLICSAAVAFATCGAVAASPPFDHTYGAYGSVLHAHVKPPRVDYARLKADRGVLDGAVESFNHPTETEERAWSKSQRLAFWINAYNAFTLRAIVDHYPIRAGWFTLQPRHSIRQIDGVWTRMTWSAAGRSVTLDDIEHHILRPEFKEPRVHFAINCASVSCPPLDAEPYQPAQLDAQLDAAARRYFASSEGLQIDGTTLRVTSILKWYGQDFVERFNGSGFDGRDAVERAILGVVAAYGPPAAASLARSPSARVAFLNYNWSLNDVGPES